MIGREIGTMAVENDLIKVIETEIKMTVEEREQFLVPLRSDCLGYLEGAIIVTEWWAMIEDNPVAYACLTERDLEEVVLFVIVHPSRRNIGIGKFMVRFATDQAIRHRKRVVIAFAEYWARHIEFLENEEFERDPSSSMLRKELKWQ